MPKYTEPRCPSCKLNIYIKPFGHLYKLQDRPSIQCLLNSSTRIHHKHFKYVIWKHKILRDTTQGYFNISFLVFRPDYSTNHITLKTQHRELYFSDKAGKCKITTDFGRKFNSFEEWMCHIQETETRQIKYHRKLISDNLYSASSAVRRHIFKPLPKFEEYPYCDNYIKCEHKTHSKQDRNFSSSEDEGEGDYNNPVSTKGLAIVEFQPLVVRKSSSSSEEKGENGSSSATVVE
jgi:hypothetical protein